MFQGVKTDREQPAGQGIHVLLELQNASVNDIVLARDDTQLPVFDLMKDHARHSVSGRRGFRMDGGSQTDAKAQTWR